jgi:DNA-directed RNA polymerase specialized sigma24 family protein
MAGEDIVSEALIKLWERLKVETIDPVPRIFSLF